MLPRKWRAGLLLALAAVAVAADAPDTLELSAVGVAGRPVDSAAASVHRLNQEQLLRFASLADALASIPGFRMRQAGGLGGYSELSFRGADAGAVEIDLDGIRLNQEGESAPDLSKWPLLWFSGLTARSGFDAFGAGAPGTLARIDLSTASPHRAEAAARLGSFSTAEAAAAVSGGSAWKWTVGLEGQDSRNDYPYSTDNYTVYNAGDDAATRLANNAYWSRGARASLQRASEAGSQTLSLIGIEYLKQYPGLFPAQAQAYTRHQEWLGAWRDRAFFDGGAWLEAGIQARRFEDDYRDPAQTLGYLSYAEARVSTAVEADARVHLPLGSRWEVESESRARWESVQPTATPFDQAFASPAAERLNAGLGLTLRRRFTRNLSVTGEARGEGMQFDAAHVLAFPVGDSTAPASQRSTPLAARAAGEWENPWGLVVFLGRWEERAPSAQELLGDNLGIRPDLGLQSQQTRSGEATGTWRRGGLRVQTSLFWNEYHNPIRLEAYGSTQFLHYANGPAYRAAGWENEAHVQTRRFEISFALTWQDLSVLSGPAQGLWPAYQTPLEGHAEFFWKPLSGLAAGPTLDLLGPYYPGDLDLPGTHRPPSWRWGAQAEARRGPMRLAFDARNLGDERAQDFAYSVQSGRSFDLTLSLNL